MIANMPERSDKDAEAAEQRKAKGAELEASGDVKHLSQLEMDFSLLGFNDAVNVMKAATPDEHDRLWHAYVVKRRQALRRLHQSGQEIPEGVFDQVQ